MGDKIEYVTKTDAQRFTTGGDDGGCIDILNLPVGTYKIEEISSPTNYVLKELSTQSIEVKEYSDKNVTNFTYFLDTLVDLTKGITTKSNMDYILAGQSLQTSGWNSNNKRAYISNVFSSSTTKDSDGNLNLSTIKSKYTNNQLTGTNALTIQQYIARVKRKT